jgi:opacity protein-like surface antigen
MKSSTRCLVAVLLLIGAAFAASAQTFPDHKSCYGAGERGYYGTPYGDGPQYGSGGGDQYGYGPGFSYARQAPSCISRGTSLNGRSPLSGR